MPSAAVQPAPLSRRPFGQNYAFVVVAVIFLALLSSAGLRGVPWQLFLTWGLLSGIGSGAVAGVLGATIVNRWFTTNRGLVMGLLTASTATGALIFTPGLAALAEWGGWKPVVLTVAACCAALIPLVYVLVPERPASIGLRSFGSQHDDHPAPAMQGNPFTAALSNLARAATTQTFWFLFATFFICGFTTIGLVSTHLIAFCGRPRNRRSTGGEPSRVDGVL
jgi:MFS family permease